MVRVEMLMVGGDADCKGGDADGEMEILMVGGDTDGGVTLR